MHNLSNLMGGLELSAHEPRHNDLRSYDSPANREAESSSAKSSFKDEFHREVKQNRREARADQRDRPQSTDKPLKSDTVNQAKVKATSPPPSVDEIHEDHKAPAVGEHVKRDTVSEGVQPSLEAGPAVTDTVMAEVAPLRLSASVGNELGVTAILAGEVLADDQSLQPVEIIPAAGVAAGMAYAPLEPVASLGNALLRGSNPLSVAGSQQVADIPGFMPAAIQAGGLDRIGLRPPGFTQVLGVPDTEVNELQLRTALTATDVFSKAALISDGQLTDGSSVKVDAEAKTSLVTLDSLLGRSLKSESAQLQDLKPAVEAFTDTKLSLEAAKPTAAAGFGPSALTESQSLTSPRVQIPVNISFGKPQWAGMVAERTAMMAAQNIQTADLQLDPPELGPLQVRVHVQNDQVSVSFVSAQGNVREALDATANRLRELCDQQGMHLVDVDVSDQKDHDQQHADMGGQARSADEESEENPESTVNQLQFTASTGIDYYA